MKYKTKTIHNFFILNVKKVHQFWPVKKNPMEIQGFNSIYLNLNSF